MKSGLSQLSRKGCFNKPLGTQVLWRGQHSSMTVSSLNAVHPPRAGKVGDPLVANETREDELTRAKGDLSVAQPGRQMLQHLAPKHLQCTSILKYSAAADCDSYCRHVIPASHTEAHAVRQHTSSLCQHLQQLHSQTICPPPRTLLHVNHITGYPYARPPTSFIFVNGPQAAAPAAYTFENAHWVTPSSWHGSLSVLMGLQVTGPQGFTQR
jgi:hypothetical protein